MWKIEKTILITNNSKVYEKYKEKLKCIFMEKYEDVLIKVRDLVYDKHLLLTHPQASSLKPNQTLFRSIMVYPKGDENNVDDILLIEKCIEVFYQWQSIAKSPSKYEKKVEDDFKTIDLSVIDNVMRRLV